MIFSDLVQWFRLPQRGKTGVSNTYLEALIGKHGVTKKTLGAPKS